MPKNIIVFNQDIPAGVSTIIKNIIQYKPEATTTYRLILYSRDDYQGPRIIENWCSELYRIKIATRDNLFYTIKQLAKHVNKDSIIVANDLIELRMAVLLRLKNPLIYIVHGDFGYYYSHCTEFQDYVDLFIVYSEHIYKKLIIKLKDENKTKIRLIYYPVADITPNQESSQYLNLIFVGSLIKRKGVDLLPAIINGIDKLKIPYKMKIIGYGELVDFLNVSFSKHSNISIIGHLPSSEVISSLSKNDILLFPTRSEGLPNVLVEAMKAGCVPVVSNILSGIPDVVKDNENGFLVRPDQISDFVKKIKILANDRQLLKAMRERAVATTRAMFDPHVNAAKYFNEFISAKPKSVLPTTKVSSGGILNKPWIPNPLVKAIRSLNLHPKL